MTKKPGQSRSTVVAAGWHGFLHPRELYPQMGGGFKRWCACNEAQTLRWTIKASSSTRN